MCSRGGACPFPLCRAAEGPPTSSAQLSACRGRWPALSLCPWTVRRRRLHPQLRPRLPAPPPPPLLGPTWRAPQRDGAGQPLTSVASGQSLLHSGPVLHTVQESSRPTPPRRGGDCGRAPEPGAAGGVEANGFEPVHCDLARALPRSGRGCPEMLKVRWLPDASRQRAAKTDPLRRLQGEQHCGVDARWQVSRAPPQRPRRLVLGRGLVFRTGGRHQGADHRDQVRGRPGSPRRWHCEVNCDRRWPALAPLHPFKPGRNATKRIHKINEELAASSDADRDASPSCGRRPSPRGPARPSNPPPRRPGLRRDLKKIVDSTSGAANRAKVRRVPP